MPKPKYKIGQELALHRRNRRLISHRVIVIDIDEDKYAHLRVPAVGYDLDFPCDGPGARTWMAEPWLTDDLERVNCDNCIWDEVEKHIKEYGTT